MRTTLPLTFHFGFHTRTAVRSGAAASGSSSSSSSVRATAESAASKSRGTIATPVTPRAKREVIDAGGSGSGGSVASTSLKPVQLVGADAVPLPRRGDVHVDVAAIEQCHDVISPWSVLRRFTTKKDLRDVRDMCERLSPSRWREIYVSFFHTVAQAQAARPTSLRVRDRELPDDWFHAPFYYTYVQYFGTDAKDAEATFAHLKTMLDYLERSGIRNIFILPHYESPMGDGGYDVSDFVPRESLGGEAQYRDFLDEANRRGFRVCSDLPVNHTSVQHRWLQAALAGDEEKLRLYLQCTGREKLEEVERDGDLICRYREPDGQISERVLIFPDIDREHGRQFQVNGRDVHIYREFYPFQLDLDLQQPETLAEIFALLARESNEGILGKRTDAIAHWIKKPGTTADGLPETHAIHALLKSFVRHVNPKAIILPEAVRATSECATYCGMETEINGKTTSSEGDALFNFDMQGALREMLYFQTTRPFWERVFTIPSLPANATYLNLLEHHDETYLGMISQRNRSWLGMYIESKGGKVYKNGMSAGGRYADCLDHDPARIANAILALYLTPGVPVMYFGTEIGAGNDPAHAARAQANQYRVMRELGVDVDFERCFDPRELQRGPIPRAHFEEALARDDGPHAMWRKLNALYEKWPSLGSRLLTPIGTGHDGVLGMVKFTGDAADRPVLALVNVSSHALDVRVPIDQLKAKFGAHVDADAVVVRDLLTDADVRLAVHGGVACLRMEPHARVLAVAV